MRRVTNSESDFRNFLKAGSFEVSGYTGESSYVLLSVPAGYSEGRQKATYLLKGFSEVVQRINDTVIIDCLIFVDSVITTTRPEYTVD